MILTSTTFIDNVVIPAECAFCAPDPDTGVSFAGNQNPHLAWQDVPAGTQSFVLLCHDPDAPSDATDVNQEGRLIPADLPRIKFYHWVLIDIPVTTRELIRASHSNVVTPTGKDGPLAIEGMRHGINDYTQWFAGDANMAGNYYGYDGPCPPWNDTIAHRYVFTLYALDINHCPVDGTFSGPDVLAAIVDHILAEAQLIGRYSLNPDVAV